MNLPAQTRTGAPLWALAVALAVYCGLVTGWLWVNYWRSPGYQAAERYEAALELLGVDDGRSCAARDLERAMMLTLEAARLVPRERSLAEHVERLRWRFEERHFKLPVDLARHAEIVSAAARQLDEARAGWLPISARDRGWSRGQLLAGPRQAVLWSTPGALFVIIAWAWLRFGARAVRKREHEEHLRSIEREVESSEASRRRARRP